MQPVPANPIDRIRAQTDFQFFCEHYLPELFYCPWHEDALVQVRLLREVVLCHENRGHSGERASGKTTTAVAALLWAYVTGHHRHSIYVSGSQTESRSVVENLVLLFLAVRPESNLAADFPERLESLASTPEIREGIADQFNRCGTIGLGSLLDPQSIRALSVNEQAFVNLKDNIEKGFSPPSLIITDELNYSQMVAVDRVYCFIRNLGFDCGILQIERSKG